MPQAAHAHDQHVLVVTAVENADFPALGQGANRTPHVIVRQFLLAGLLEAVHLDTLRVQAAHYMLDGAVLTGGVHGLDHDDHALGALRVQLVLQVDHALDVLGHAGLDTRAIGFVNLCRRGVIGDLERSLTFVTTVFQLQHGITFRRVLVTPIVAETAGSAGVIAEEPL